MALPSTGIRISNVRSTLGETTNDLGSLCASPKINQFSFWKPVTSPVLSMTQAELFRVNDGFTINSYNSPIDLWNAVNNNQTWIYRPQDNAAPYRLGDFRTYEHYAEPWFTWGFMDNSQASKNESRPIENLGTQNLQWVWGNFQAFNWLSSSTQDTACLGLLMSPQKTGQDNSVYFYRICSTLDYDSERLNFTVPNSLNSYDTTYYFTPVLSTVMNTADGSVTYYTEANPPTTTGFWWPLKGNVFSLYLKNQEYIPPKPFSISLNIDSINFDYLNYEISNLEGDITVTLSKSVTYPVNFGTTIYYDNSPSPVVCGNIGGTFAAGETSKTLHFNHKDSFVISADLKEEDQLSFRCETSYSFLGYNYNQTDYLIGYKN